jgi:hypothetical protein
MGIMTKCKNVLRYKLQNRFSFKFMFFPQKLEIQKCHNHGKIEHFQNNVILGKHCKSVFMYIDACIHILQH